MRNLFVAADMKLLNQKGKMEECNHDKQTDQHNQQVF